MNEVLSVGASLLLLAWFGVVWKGGPLLAREFVRCYRTGHRKRAVLLLLGPIANLALILHEICWQVLGLDSLFRIGIAAPFRAAALLTGAGFMIIAALCRRALGPLWTVTPTPIRPELRTSGPYAVVRHPVYSSCILFYLSALVAFDSYIACVVCVAQVGGFLVKATVEDRLLSSLMATEYRVYREAVPWRVLPWVW